MIKKILILIAAVVILAGFFFLLRGNEDTWLCVNGQWVKHGNSSLAQPTEPCGFMVINNFQSCATAGNAILESYPRQCKTSDGQTFVEDIGNELAKSELIRIDQPRPGQVISNPLEISGQARGTWFFEASFPILLLDKDGKTISQTIATATSNWMTEEFVPFKAKLEFPTNLSGRVKLIFKKDNPSGLPQYDDQLEMPLSLQGAESIETENIKVKVFFSNSQLDPEFSCNKVFFVERNILKTQAVARAALEELLKGQLTNEEEVSGFFTSINPNVKIQKLTIVDNVARVDFDKQLEFQVGGSCRVSAIRAQIEQTLKQFSTVKEVVISIDGRIEDVLQP